MGHTLGSDASAQGKSSTSRSDEVGANYGTLPTCCKCRKVPAAGDKLRFCAGCGSVKYCSSACQTAAWPNHRVMCKTYGAAREKALANHERRSPGEGKKSLKREDTAVYTWFNNVPGLADRVQFLAWKHRTESPVVVVTTLTTTSNDSVPDVQVLPRALWDNVSMERQRIGRLDDAAMAARTYFARSDFRRDEMFLVYLHVGSITGGGAHGVGGSSELSFSPYMSQIHNSALMSLSAEDFAAEMLRGRRDRTNSAVFVRLKGLRGAAHLNGREGVLTGQDPENKERMTVCLDGGKIVSVQSHNYESLTRPKIFNFDF